MQWLQIVGVVKGLVPDAADGLEGDHIISGSADLLNVDPNFVREQRKIDEIRQKTAQAKQQQAQMAQAQQAADIAHKATGAKKQHAEALFSIFN